MTGDSGNKPEDSGKKPEDSGKKPEDSEKKPEDSGKKPEGSEKTPEDSEKKPEDSEKKPEDSGKKPRPRPDPYIPTTPPLVVEFRRTLAEPLEMIKNLKDLKIISENLPSMPKIIVVGDDQVGKTKLVVNLTDFHFPDKWFPIVINFVLDSSPDIKKMHYHYNDKIVDFQVNPTHLGPYWGHLATALKDRTKITSDSFLVLNIPNQELAGLTIVKLPGYSSSSINRHKQESEVIRGYALQHMGEDECLFLHVISAASDSCQSAKVLKDLDPFGKRTVTVVTHMDLCTPRRRIEFTYNETNTPFGFAFVQNLDILDKYRDKISDSFPNMLKTRFGDARVSRAIAVAMLSLMFKPSSLICERVDEELNTLVEKVKQSQRKFNNIGEALPIIINIVGSLQISLYKLFISQDYCEYKNNKEMHACERLSEKVERLYPDLMILIHQNKEPFLSSELKRSSGSGLYSPKLFISSTVFNDLLEQQIQHITPHFDKYVIDMWNYVKTVISRVLIDCSSGHEQLLESLRNTAERVIEWLETEFEKKFLNILKKENIIIRTSDEDFISKCTEFDSTDFDALMDFNKHSVSIKGLGFVAIGHLKKYPMEKLKAAFKMKMLLIAYCEVAWVDASSSKVLSWVEEMVTGKFVRMMICETWGKFQKVSRRRITRGGFGRGELVQW